MSRSRLVYVVYNPTPLGVEAIRYAASLAILCGELRVLLPEGSRDPDELPGLFNQVVRWVDGPSSASLRAWGDTYGVAELMPAGDPATFAFAPDSILVGSAARRDVHALSPCAESRVLADAALLPLGSRESGRFAIERGLPIVRELGFDRVVFYHTTYRNTSVRSEDARDHMDPGARELLEDAYAAARAAGLKAEEMLEAAPKVSDGIVGAALATRCSLIVMARGLSRRGIGYVEEVLEASPVPVLVVGRGSEVK